MSELNGTITGNQGLTGNLAMSYGIHGKDGVSPTVDVTEENGVATLSITDVNGSKTAILDVSSKANAIVNKVQGEAIAVKDSAYNHLKGLRVFGKSTQDGKPTPDAPVDIVSIENPTVTVGEQSLVLNYALRSLPVVSGGNYTDTDGQQYVCDEVDLERGVYVQRIKEFNLASISTWATNSSWANANAFFCGNAIKDAVPVSGYMTKANMLCNRLEISSPQGISSTIVNAIGQGSGSGLYLSVEGITTTTELKTYFAENETHIYYILAEPIETDLTAEEIEAYKSLYTNYPNTTVLNDSGAYMEVSYNADTKLYIDNKIAELVK